MAIWQTPAKKKRGENSSQNTNDLAKQPKQILYQIPISNSFDVLYEVNGEASNITTNNEQKLFKPPKPEPIFVTGVIQIEELNKILKTLVNNDQTKYILSTMKSGHIVKLMPADVEAYKIIRKRFIENNISHYTYLLKHERAYRIVMRGVHHSADLNEIKFELSDTR